MQPLCLKCKGKYPQQYCGKTYCPILAKTQAKVKSTKNIKKDWSGETPNVFISRIGYPNLHVGLLSPPNTENTTLHDAPREWASQNYNINQIIDLRSSLVNSRFLSNIKGTSKFIEIAQEVGQASKPVDIEINLHSKPIFFLNTNPYTAPMGPNANLTKAFITSNPKIDTRVDRIVSDTDFKATPAIAELFQKGYDENFLTKILSTGNLGIKYQRKLVPTRWSITAVDDILAKQIRNDILNNEQTNHKAFFGQYLGNYFLVLFFPGVWSYELFEMYKPGASWNPTDELHYTTDYENYKGRTTYAQNCAGGYYAARLPILEKLKELKRQGAIVTLRVITPDYFCPLGVFVVREAVRKAMQSEPIEFANKDLMLNYTKLLIKRKFGFDINTVIKNSITLKNIKEQSKLNQFF